jgi:hypothetical protein
MRRTALLISILLAFAACSVAQNNSGSSPKSLDPNNMTIQGCLGGDVGEFTLTARSGTTYQLTGNTANMNVNVGHTVRVTGLKPSGMPAPGSMAASADTNTDTRPALSVISFEDVSPRCDVQRQ